MRGIFVLIGAPIIGYALAKGGLYFYTKHELDKAIEQAADRVTINYEKLDAGLDGQFELRNVLVKPMGESETIEIPLITVKGPDVFSFALDHLPFIGDPHAPPKFLRVNLAGMKAVIGNNTAAPQIDPIKICENLEDFDPSLLDDLGYKELTADADLSWNLDDKAKELNLEFSIIIPAIQRMATSVQMINVSADTLANPQQMPGIKRAEFSLELMPEFGNKVAGYCGNQMSMSVNDYKDYAANNAIYHAAANGVRLGIGLQAAIKDFYHNWGKIELVASPPQPINPVMLMLTPPASMEQVLGLQLSHNQRLITDLSLTVQKEAPTFVRKKSDAYVEEAPAPTIQYKQVWRNVEPASLTHYIDKNARLKMRNGNIQNGAVMGVQSGKVELEQRVSGGKFNVPLAIADIVSAEVLLTEKVETPAASKVEAKP